MVLLNCSNDDCFGGWVLVTASDTASFSNMFHNCTDVVPKNNLKNHLPKIRFLIKLLGFWWTEKISFKPVVEKNVFVVIFVICVMLNNLI